MLNKKSVYLKFLAPIVVLNSIVHTLQPVSFASSQASKKHWDFEKLQHFVEQSTFFSLKGIIDDGAFGRKYVLIPNPRVFEIIKASPRLKRLSLFDPHLPWRVSAFTSETKHPFVQRMEKSVNQRSTDKKSINPRSIYSPLSLFHAVKNPRSFFPLATGKRVFQALGFSCTKNMWGQITSFTFPDIDEIMGNVHALNEKLPPKNRIAVKFYSALPNRPFKNQIVRFALTGSLPFVDITEGSHFMHDILSLMSLVTATPKIIHAYQAFTRDSFIFREYLESRVADVEERFGYYPFYEAVFTRFIHNLYEWVGKRVDKDLKMLSVETMVNTPWQNQRAKKMVKYVFFQDPISTYQKDFTFHSLMDMDRLISSLTTLQYLDDPEWKGFVRQVIKDFYKQHPDMETKHYLDAAFTGEHMIPHIINHVQELDKALQSLK